MVVYSGDNAAAGRLKVNSSKSRAIAISSAALSLGGVGSAQAYTPPSLAPGQTFRLAFVTNDGIDATSTAIATYNAFANSEAGLDTSLPSVLWFAAVSTDAMSALTNVDCGGACSADPIYSVGGVLLAPDIASFFSAVPSELTYQNGASLNYNYLWTGSNNGGTIATGNALGDTYPATTAPPGSFDWYSGADNQANSDSLIVISGELSASAVPEPSTWALLAGGFAALAGVAGLRRRAQAAAVV